MKSNTEPLLPTEVIYNNTKQASPLASYMEDLALHTDSLQPQGVGSPRANSHKRPLSRVESALGASKIIVRSLIEKEAGERVFVVVVPNGTTKTSGVSFLFKYYVGAAAHGTVSAKNHGPQQQEIEINTEWPFPVFGQSAKLTVVRGTCRADVQEYPFGTVNLNVRVFLYADVFTKQARRPDKDILDFLFGLEPEEQSLLAGKPQAQPDESSLLRAQPHAPRFSLNATVSVPLGTLINGAIVVFSLFLLLAASPPLLSPGYRSPSQSVPACLRENETYRRP